MIRTIRLIRTIHTKQKVPSPAKCNLITEQAGYKLIFLRILDTMINDPLVQKLYSKNVTICGNKISIVTKIVYVTIK